MNMLQKNGNEIDIDDVEDEYIKDYNDENKGINKNENVEEIMKKMKMMVITANDKGLQDAQDHIVVDENDVEDNYSLDEIGIDHDDQNEENNDKNEDDIFDEETNINMENFKEEVMSNIDYVGDDDDSNNEDDNKYNNDSVIIVERWELLCANTGKKIKQAFEESQQTMPWLVLRFSNENTRKNLNQTFQVNHIPSLVVVDKDGRIITPYDMELFEEFGVEGYPFIAERIVEVTESQTGHSVKRSRTQS